MLANFPKNCEEKRAYSWMFGLESSKKKRWRFTPLLDRLCYDQKTHWTHRLLYQMRCKTEKRIGCVLSPDWQTASDIGGLEQNESLYLGGKKNPKTPSTSPTSHFCYTRHLVCMLVPYNSVWLRQRNKHQFLHQRSHSLGLWVLCGHEKLCGRSDMGEFVEGDDGAGCNFLDIFLSLPKWQWVKNLIPCPFT